MKALVLDFDGVIAQSAREALVVALRAYLELTPASPLATREPEELYRGFVELMPLGNRAEDFGVALRALESRAHVADQGAYDAFCGALDPTWRREFHLLFYKVRTEFAAADPEGWRALLPPYPEFLGALRRHAGEVQLAIASAKDRASVYALLESYGVQDLFSRELILDKEAGVHKTSHLERLHTLLGFPYAQFTFVDDKVNHLDAVSRLGVRCVLAAWGYNGPREHALAHAHGHHVCKLDEVEALLFASTPDSTRG